MKKISLNADWTVRPLSREGAARQVTLPHDAMIDEPRSAESKGGGNIGWFVGGDYEYTRTLFAPKEWAGGKVLLEFEGVYHNAEVFVNGEPAAFRPYGYTNFYVEVGNLLRYGKDNDLRVIARNADQPNSRWYPGTGIYRPVNLWLGGEEHILVNGVRIRTLDYRTGEIEVHVRTSKPGELCLEILDGDAVVLSQRHTSKKRSVRFRVTMRQPKLWSPERPHLYTARVTFGGDAAEETFGIRTLAWSARKGLTINGERVILRGACVHHDNGPLGACAFPEAEERKVRLLKENGYNALRSAHNPCSKALLEACDRLGMLVLDEYADAWTVHKTSFDYAAYLRDWWRQDLKDMAEKDYNHPSVIMYSLGNEVAETAGEEGVRFTGEMTRYLHELDDTRPVTCGINVFFNLLSSMSLGGRGTDKADRQAALRQQAGSSALYNRLAHRMGDRFVKWGATLRGSDAKTRDAFAKLDVAGYNYGIQRYRKDLKRYPNRLILGTETFVKDAWLFREIARDNPAILGDFVWSGMDYLGETSLGAPEYGDYRLPGEAAPITGGNGRLDITGRPRAEAAYTRVVFGQQDGPAIAVQPVDRDDDPDLNPWALTRAVESWAWTGCAGRSAIVEVYARAAEVELKLNGRSLARKRADRTCRTLFRVPWEAGRLEVVAYDAAGNVAGTRALHSAGPETELRLLPETASVRPNGLCYVRLRFTDSRGVWKPLERRRLTAAVENGALAGLCSGSAYVRGGYGGPTTDTYYGEALAVLRAGAEGYVTLTVTAEGMEEPETLILPVLDEEPILLEHPTEPEGLEDYDLPEGAEEAPAAPKADPDAEAGEAEPDGDEVVPESEDGATEDVEIEAADEEAPAEGTEAEEVSEEAPAEGAETEEPTDGAPAGAGIPAETFPAQDDAEPVPADRDADAEPAEAAPEQPLESARDTAVPPEGGANSAMRIETSPAYEDDEDASDTFIYMEDAEAPAFRADAEDAVPPVSAFDGHDTSGEVEPDAPDESEPAAPEPEPDVPVKPAAQEPEPAERQAEPDVPKVRPAPYRFVPTHIEFDDDEEEPLPGFYEDD